MHRLWLVFLLETLSVARILAFPHFFVGLWPYCGAWPISVTGKATTDTTGSHINSKQKISGRNKKNGKNPKIFRKESKTKKVRK